LLLAKPTVVIDWRMLCVLLLLQVDPQRHPPARHAACR
jgi:hypothetical protein